MDQKDIIKIIKSGEWTWPMVQDHWNLNGAEIKQVRKKVNELQEFIKIVQQKYKASQKIKGCEKIREKLWRILRFFECDEHTKVYQIKKDKTGKEIEYQIRIEESRKEPNSNDDIFVQRELKKSLIERGVG